MESENLTMRPLALVTGADRGIGLEFARQLAMNGFDLMISAGKSDLEEARDILMDLGAEVYIVTADLSKFSGAESLYREVKKHPRPLEVLTIISAESYGGPFWESDLKHELELIRMNVMASLHLTKLIIPDMVNENYGRVLFLSSRSKKGPDTFDSVHAGSLAFLSTFAQSLRKELLSYGIVVSARENLPEKLTRKDFEALMKGTTTFPPKNITSKVTDWARSYVQRHHSVQNQTESSP